MSADDWDAAVRKQKRHAVKPPMTVPLGEHCNEAYREGQAEMRERATSVCYVACGCRAGVQALPIQKRSER